MPVFPGCHPSVLCWKFRLQLNMDGNEMALDQHSADVLAQKIIVNMAESGSLNLRGSASSQSSQTAVTVGERDAAYLVSLYRNLVNGLTK